MEFIAALIPIAIIIVVFMLFRLFGAWMFRINDVVNQLEKINYQLNKLLKQKDKDSIQKP